jgi:NADH-quinone oxidoreductase subunit L
VPTACLVIAAAALSGIPPFSGFFSKELILGALADLPNPLWVAAGLLGAFLTTYYTFRLIFIILFPAQGGADTVHSHESEPAHHDGYAVMAWPLVILAAVTIGLGLGEHAVAQFLLKPFESVPVAIHHAWLPYAALGLGAAAVFLAWIEFGRRGAGQIGFVERVAPMHALFSERWYIDRAYRWLLDQVVYRLLSRLCARNDQKVIDGAVDGLGRAIAAGGGRMSILHTGMVQYRLIVLFVIIALMAVYFFI